MPAGFEIEQLVKERYLITKRLDQDESRVENKSIGAFGDVYLALDTLEDNRPVVIKALKDEWINHERAKKLFLKEAEALNRLTEEPRVVRLLSSKEHINGEVFFLEASGRPFFVMEFIKGKNLREIFKAGKPDNKIVSHYIEQLAIAVYSIHEKKITHRDLKPENIMIIERENQPAQLKVVDFGTALVGYSAYFPSTIYTEMKQKPFVGTPAYASPEHLNGQESFIGEIFTLAVIACEMLTGKITFPGDSIEKVKALHQKGVDFPETFSKRTVEILKKGLAIDPGERYQSPTEFAEALREALSADPEPRPIVPATALTAAQAASPEDKKSLSKMLFRVAVILALLAMSWLGVIYWPSSKLAAAPNANVNSAPAVLAKTAEALFKYSFEVQKMKDNLIDGRPFETADKSKIAIGDKFNLKVEREKAGNFYIVEQDGETLNLIFPNSDREAKSINGWRVAKPGRLFYLIWSKESLAVLENIPLDQGSAARFLQENQKNIEAAENLDKMEVKNSDNLVIYKLSL